MDGGIIVNGYHTAAIRIRFVVDNYINDIADLSGRLLMIFVGCAQSDPTTLSQVTVSLWINAYHLHTPTEDTLISK